MLHYCEAYAYDNQSGRFLKEARLPAGREIYLTAVSSDGRYGVTAGQTNTVRVYELATGQGVSLEHKAHTYSASLSGDGRLAATGGGESLVRLWDVATQKQLRECRMSGHIYATAVSRDGKRFLGINSDKRIQVWNVKPEDDGEYVDCPFQMSVAAFSVDSRYALGWGNEGTVLMALSALPGRAPVTSPPAGKARN